MTDAEVEQLLAHQAAYFAFAATVTQTPAAWFLDCPAIAMNHDLNRAIHLRDDGRGADAIVGEIAAHFQARGLPAVADVDAVAEAQGFGATLRARGFAPMSGSPLLMRFPSSQSLALPASGLELTIETVASETGAGEMRTWVETVMSEEQDTPPDEAAMWQAIAEHEARSPHCRLYLARLQAQPDVAVGACDLFQQDGWGRIDSVVTHPDWRRRGVASALVARAVADSLSAGNAVTYLFTQAGGAGEQVYTRLGFEVWSLNVLRRYVRW